MPPVVNEFQSEEERDVGPDSPLRCIDDAIFVKPEGAWHRDEDRYAIRKDSNEGDAEGSERSAPIVSMSSDENEYQRFDQRGGNQKERCHAQYCVELFCFHRHDLLTIPSNIAPPALGDRRDTCTNKFSAANRMSSGRRRCWTVDAE